MVNKKTKGGHFMKLSKARTFIVSMVLIAAILLSSAASPLQAAVAKPPMSEPEEEAMVCELSSDPEQEAAVRAYWGAIDRNDWSAWVE